MIALVGLRDQLVDLAVGNLGQDAVAFTDWEEDGVEHGVDFSHEIAIAALEILGLAALAQLSVVRGLYESGNLIGESCLLGVVLNDLNDADNFVVFVVARRSKATDRDLSALDNIYSAFSGHGIALRASPELPCTFHCDMPRCQTRPTS